MAKIKAFFRKINNLPLAAKASFWFVISNIALKGMSFITTPIFTRILDGSDYGVTSVFVSWEGIISIFATLSLAGGVYNVAMTKFGDDIEAYTSTMLGLSFVSSTIVYGLCILVNFLYPTLFNLDSSYLIYMWIQTFTNAVITFWLMRKRFNYSYKPVIIYTFVNALISPLLAILFVVLFPQNKAYAKVFGAGLAGIILGVVMCIIQLKKGKKVFSKKYWGYSLKFNLPLIPHYLSGVLMNSSDKIMINNIVGSVEAGIYGISHSISGMISIITQAINYSLIPFTLQSIKKGDYKGLKNTVTICTILVAVVCTCVMMFAKEGILIVATAEFKDAVLFVPALTMAVLFSFIYGILGNIMYYYEKTAYMSLITIICAVVNITTNYFGIIYFGYVAAGYTTLLSSALQMVLYYFLVRKHEKNLNKIVDLRWFFLIILIYTGFMVYSVIFHDIFWARLGLVLFALIMLIIFRKKIIALFKSMKKKDEEPVKEQISLDENSGEASKEGV